VTVRLAHQVSTIVGSASSSMFQNALNAHQMGWNAEYRLGSGLSQSFDNITCFKDAVSEEYGGAVGFSLLEQGETCFAVRVTDPIDDNFWVGVAYPELCYSSSSMDPKHNKKCVVWSGGRKASTNAASRPGTVRIHAEKFRNQPNYGDGDVVGLSVSFPSGDLCFFLNGTQVMEWRGILQGPVLPFVCFRHVGI